MSEQTKIEWATHTFNPWIGCTKVSPGCLNCYAEKSAPTRVARAAGKELWGKGKMRQPTSENYWVQAEKWNRDTDSTDLHGRARVFPSLCDWLDDEVPIEWLADFLKLIHDTPNLDWLLLSKRPENFKKRLTEAGDFLWDTIPMLEGSGVIRMCSDWGDFNQPPANVWPGASAEDQPRADERIPQLLKIPGGVRFLSVEPLLGPVNLHLLDVNRKFMVHHPTIDWVIVGGESGPGARPCNVEWIRDIVRQCKAAGVPCFVKQLGSNVEAARKVTFHGDNRFGGQEMMDFRIKLKHPKGGDPAEWPEDLRVREFPKFNVERSTFNVQRSERRVLP